MNVISRRALFAWLPFCIALAFHPGAGAQENAAAPDDNAVPGPGLFDEGPNPGEAGDGTELLERMATQQGLYGAQTDDRKLSALNALQQQRQLYASQLAGAVPPRGMPVWRSLGPTDTKYQTNGVTLQVTDSGRVRTILPHPTDPDTMWVLFSGGGLWKTSTFTHTNPKWEAKTDSLISTSGGAASLGRTPDTLYVGIGDPFDVRGLVAGVVVKSTDGGDTWSPFANLPRASSVRDLKVDTDGANDVVLVATNVGLYRSTDGGTTFAAVAAGPGEAFRNREVWSLARTSAGWIAAAENRASVIASGAGSLWLSTDRGATWSAIPNAGGGYGLAGRTTLAVATPGDAVVYAFAANVAGSDQRDLFRSTDGGLDWVALGITSKVPTNPTPVFQPTMDLMAGQAFYNQMITVDPTDGSRNTVYLGGQLATAKTTDGGATWTLLSDWLPGIHSNLPYVHADAHFATVSLTGGGKRVLFGTDGGVFLSEDDGATWDDSKNDGITAHLFNSIVGSPKNPQTIMGGLQDEGTRARLGASSTYNQVVGGDGEGVGWSQANNGVQLTSLPGISFRKTENLLPNTFDAWRRANQGIGGLDYYFFYTNIATPTAAADPAGLQFMTYTGWRVYATTDGAASWHVIGEAGVTPGLVRAKYVGTSPRPIFRATHHAIGVSPVDTSHVSVAEGGGFLAITANGGASWVERDLISMVPGYGGFNTSTAWANNQVLYLASENPNGGTVRLLRSTDGGATWSVRQGGLPDVPINRILVDPRSTSGDVVYAGTWIGVYRTTDGGAHWSLFGAGLPNVEVSDLYMPPDGKVLRVSTYGRGMWEIAP